MTGTENIHENEIHENARATAAEYEEVWPAVLAAYAGTVGQR